MANFGGRNWDSLFSAAEVVQDSADRMESIQRLIVHEENLLQSVPSDPKLLTSIEYHKRDLVTMFGTTRWQLEDFEREVDVSSRLSSAQVNERALSRHKQFIRAIKELLFVIEKYLRDKSLHEEVVNLQLVNSNEQDSDVLASFLSGPNAKFQQIEFNHQRKSQGDVHGTPASSHTEQLNEIMEIHPEETEGTMMNCNNHMASNLQFVKSDELTGIESQQMKQSAKNSASFQNGDNRSMFCGYYAVNMDFNNFKARNFLRLSDSMRYFCNFWLPSRSMLVRSHTKRRKDGEVMDNSDLDPEQGRLHGVLELAQNQQGLRCWGFPSCIKSNKIIPCPVLTNTLEGYCSRLGVSIRVFRFHNLPHFNRFLILLPLGLFTILMCMWSQLWRKL